MSHDCHLRTEAWYGDREMVLPCPDGWSVSTHTPRTPPPLSDAEIEGALRRPVGQEPISRLARGRSRPLVLVDDLTRPTPAARVFPPVLRHLAEAGISADDVTVLVATGTHRGATRQAVLKKVGPETADRCRLLVHDDGTNVTKVGRTSLGTPVFVNREVLASDFLIGIGGVYPQSSTGFGGGSKLALGVLGRRSIARLHFGHPSMGGTYQVANDFRRDLDEIAAMIGLRTSISVHVDADREIVRVTTGDHGQYFGDAVAFAWQAYLAPLPGEADVVVSNAYPMDVSLTFMRSKGMIPLLHTTPAASRVLIAACPEGVGHHGLFPFRPSSRRTDRVHTARRALARPQTIPTKLARRAGRGLSGLRSRSGALAPTHASDDARATPARRPMLLYAPGRAPGDLPVNLPGMTAVYSWEEIVRQVRIEQEGRDDLRVAVYPAAPLQVLDLPSRASAAAPVDLAAVD